MLSIKIVIQGGEVLARVSRRGELVGWFIGATVAEVMEQIKGVRQ